MVPDCQVTIVNHVGQRQRSQACQALKMFHDRKPACMVLLENDRNTGVPMGLSMTSVGQGGGALQFSASFTETALLASLAILSLALSCWLARYPRKTSVGIMLGVLLGIFVFNVAAGFVAFLGNVLPFGQIDFWLSNFLTGIFR